MKHEYQTKRHSYKEHAQYFATDELVKEVLSCEKGDTVEVEWVAPSGITVSKVGSVRKVECIDSSKDLWITTGKDDCYIHINSETNDCWFSDDGRKVGCRKVIDFNKGGR